MKKRIVIIGGVAAGMSCAAKLHRESPETTIVVYERGHVISYAACGLPYFVGGEVKEATQLVQRSASAMSDATLKIKTRHEVLAVDSVKRQVTVRDLEEKVTFVTSYDELVIATGAAPIQPDFYNEKTRNLFTLRSVADGLSIRETLKNHPIEKVVLIGAGYINVELAEAFRTLGKHVTLINRSENLLKPFDREMREKVAEHLRQKGVELVLGEPIAAIESDETGWATAVRTQKKTYPADLVVAATGVKPETDFLGELPIERLKNGALVVNERLETSVDHVYAIGDCATLYHRVLKKPVHIPLATYANKQGRVLGEILSGKDRTFPGGLGAAVIKVFDLTLSRVGLGEKEAADAGVDYDTVFVKSSAHASYYPGNTPLFIKYIFEKTSEVLLGAQLCGEQGAAHRINALSIAIDRQMTLEDIALSDFVYSPPYAGPWDATQIAANVGR